MKILISTLITLALLSSTCKKSQYVGQTSDSANATVQEKMTKTQLDAKTTVVQPSEVAKPMDTLKKKAPLINKNSKKTTIYGQITFTRRYCGGAPPPESLLKELNTPQPYSGLKLYFRASQMTYKDGYEASAITDENGEFEVTLREGEIYRVFDSLLCDINAYNALINTYGKKTEYYSSIDKKCLESKMEIGLFVIDTKEVTETKKVINNIVKGCEDIVPCAQYIGPIAN